MEPAWIRGRTAAGSRNSTLALMHNSYATESRGQSDRVYVTVRSGRDAHMANGQQSKCVQQDIAAARADGQDVEGDRGSDQHQVSQVLIRQLAHGDGWR